MRAQFLADLSALLKRYHAEIEAVDCFTGYAECGEDLQLLVTLEAINGDDGEYGAKQQFEMFKLGCFVDYKHTLEARDA